MSRGYLNTEISAMKTIITENIFGIKFPDCTQRWNKHASNPVPFSLSLLIPPTSTHSNPFYTLLWVFVLNYKLSHYPALKILMVSPLIFRVMLQLLPCPTFPVIVLSPCLYHTKLFIDCDPNTSCTLPPLTAHQPVLYVTHFYSCFKIPVQMSPLPSWSLPDFHKRSSSLLAL